MESEITVFFVIINGSRMKVSASSTINTSIEKNYILQLMYHGGHTFK